MAHILVIDDYEALLFMVRAMLEVAGHEVTTAVDGMMGLEKAAERRPDLVLLDTDMPGLGGFAVCRRIKQAAGLEHVPVLMMTGRPGVGVFTHAESAGARVMLIKPFTGERLLAEIAQALPSVPADK
ncbi:MAG: response regulator [Opitutaceae bacterium]|jgi:CheY-like chemotaxis protein